MELRVCCETGANERAWKVKDRKALCKHGCEAAYNIPRSDQAFDSRAGPEIVPSPQ